MGVIYSWRQQVGERIESWHVFSKSNIGENVSYIVGRVHINIKTVALSDSASSRHLAT